MVVPHSTVLALASMQWTEGCAEERPDIFDDVDGVTSTTGTDADHNIKRETHIQQNVSVSDIAYCLFVSGCIHGLELHSRRRL
jgi:hypothetical protein